MLETVQRFAGARNVLFWTVFLSINASHHCLHVDVGYPDCCFVSSSMSFFISFGCQPLYVIHFLYVSNK